MKRAILAALSVALLSSCSALDRAEIRSCEQKLVGGLKSPSSYERVKTNVWDEDISFENLAGRYFGLNLLPYEKQLLDEVKGRAIKVRRTSIEYDADNSYGAAIRDSFYCNFIVVDGELYSPSAAYDAKWSQHIDEIVGTGPTTILTNEYYAEPQDALAPDYDPFPGSGIQLPPY